MSLWRSRIAKLARRCGSVADSCNALQNMSLARFAGHEPQQLHPLLGCAHRFTVESVHAEEQNDHRQISFGPNQSRRVVKSSLVVVRAVTPKCHYAETTRLHVPTGDGCLPLTQTLGG